MIAVAILRRRLRPGRTYEDFRKAWYHETGFAAPNRMLTMINIADPREIIVIGMTQAETIDDARRLLATDQDERRRSPLDDVIEPEIHRTFGLLVAEDDFSGRGPLEYTPPAVSGQPTDLSLADAQLAQAAGLLRDYLPG